MFFSADRLPGIKKDQPATIIQHDIPQGFGRIITVSPDKTPYTPRSTTFTERIEEGFVIYEWRREGRIVSSSSSVVESASEPIKPDSKNSFQNRQDIQGNGIPRGFRGKRLLALTGLF